VEWIEFLRKEKRFGPEDPLFPKSHVEPGPDLQFAAVGLDHAPWANAHPVRALFKQVFARVGLPYFNPHSFRNTLVQLAYELKLDAEQFKAWSQNLGHEYCLTTFVSYGQLPAFRQAEIMRELAKPKPTLDTEDAAAMLRKLAEQWERKQQRG
jgi:integrase/recombinase XerD